MFKLPHANHNRDMLGFTPDNAQKYFVNIHNGYGRKGWKSKLIIPPMQMWEGREVVRCDLAGGFKAIAAEKFIAHISNDVVVYCAPRAGHAALAVAKLAKMYGKKAVFFAPSSKQCTDDQACVLNYGADLRFLRIAAMPNLNLEAKKWAERNGAQFLPFGLANTEQITAGIVNLCRDLTTVYGKPKEVWCATSTGTMVRGLEIGLPMARIRTIAVARNMQVGEYGDIDIVSSEVPFLTKAKIQPPFDTTAHYDAKAWERCITEGRHKSWFINVGSDAMVREAARSIDNSKIDSYRDWGDRRDLERGL